jgi:hypothetical protein
MVMPITRRSLLSAAGLTVLTAAAPASTLGQVLKVGPKPKLIKGDKLKGIPDTVDFGHGLLVPMSREAFEALWEGDDRWIAYGHGNGHSKAAAMGQAEEAAEGTMKLFLLTLAFGPEKLMRIDGGGWRLKSGKTADLVRGDLDLPGRPLMPTVDELSGGDSDSDAAGLEPYHATTGWLIWKKEVTLDTVRRIAQVVPDGT